MKIKIGRRLGTLLKGLVNDDDREAIAAGLERIEDAVDKLGDLARGSDDDETLAQRLLSIEARLDSTLDRVAELEAALAGIEDGIGTGTVDSGGPILAEPLSS